jgi:hypothetical protein
MAIGVIGAIYVNLNRIISSSVPPYSLSTSLSKIFRDFNSFNKKIRAIRIQDINNAIALVYDIPNTLTEIATISFS